MIPRLNIALVTLGSPDRMTGGYLYHRRMAERAPRHHARIRFVSLPERPFPLTLLDARSILRDVAAGGADAIVLDSIAAAYVGPWLDRQPPAMPLVAMLHQPPGGIDHGVLRTLLQARLDRMAYRHARRLLVASDSLWRQLRAEGVSRERLRVVPPGRDTSPPASNGNLDDLRQGRRVAYLCVGNWIERKGIHNLLESFARLPPGSATLHLVGDPTPDPRYARRLQARLARPDLAGRVVVHGALPQASVAALYHAADAFVLPSVKEPYGTVYGEAMAAGLPVIGWAAGNLPYLAKDGCEGLLLPPGDVHGLADALERLAVDEAFRRQLGEAARRRAGKLLTWDDSAVLFFAAIREVVEGPPEERIASRDEG